MTKRQPNIIFTVGIYRTHLISTTHYQAAIFYVLPDSFYPFLALFLPLFSVFLTYLGSYLGGFLPFLQHICPYRSPENGYRHWLYLFAQWAGVLHNAPTYSFVYLFNFTILKSDAEGFSA